MAGVWAALGLLFRKRVVLGSTCVLTSITTFIATRLIPPIASHPLVPYVVSDTSYMYSTTRVFPLFSADSDLLGDFRLVYWVRAMLYYNLHELLAQLTSF